MLLSRFWFLVLAVAAIMGLAAALLARGIINRQHLAGVDDGLRRDRFEMESLLKLDARARLDTLAPIAADSVIREAVRTKGQSKVEGQDGQKALKDRLRTLNQQLEELRADLLIAVDANGLILAQEGRKPARAGAGLGRVPLVERALSGYIGDDVWVYDGAVYRMAARPIVDRGTYVGALLHAQRFDATLAQRLSERLGGASIGFFFRDAMIASYTPTDVPGAPTQAELAAPLAQVLTDERLKKGERTDSYDLGGRGHAVYSLVAGSASANEVGYSIARPIKVIESPWAVFDQTAKEDVDSLPRAQLAGGLVVLFLLAMGILWWERDRPLGILRASTEQLATGQIEELDLAVLSGQYRKVGERINRALDVIVEKGGGKRRAQKADLNQILGPAPETLTSSAFSFGSEAEGAPQASAPLAMPMPMPMPMPAPSPAMNGAMSAPRPAVPSMPKPPPPAPKVPAPAAVIPLVSSTSRSDDKSVMLKLDGSSDEDQTVVAEIPDQLRNASRDDESHFRDVFSQYLALREQCGESNAELTYERFAMTLRKNREQIIMSRPDARDVRFTVYVKAGKASLKASPVKT